MNPVSGMRVQGSLAEWAAAPFQTNDYELLDFGAGRRLERFGPWIFDRPSPAAEGSIARPGAWQTAHSRFLRERGNLGRWEDRQELPQRWAIRWGPLVFELKRNESGHVGIFPEQAANWNWLYRRLTRFPPQGLVLNLFAYTGGATLAAAFSGAEVVHVDAAKNVVAWARRNAECSALETRPIHWVVEDAKKFVRRELRRGKTYAGIVLDPPSYGHGPQGQVFHFERDISPLLRMCLDLLDVKKGFLIFTCHTPGYGTQRLTRLIHGIRPELWQSGKLEIKMMVIPTADGRALPSGMVARWDALGEEPSP